MRIITQTMTCFDDTSITTRTISKTFKNGRFAVRFLLLLRTPARFRRFWCGDPGTGPAAYTLDNNMFVTTADGKTQQVTDEPKGIVCGQSVHRQEFGISKGTALRIRLQDFLRRIQAR